MAKFIPVIKTTSNNIITWYRYDHENHDYSEYGTADEAYSVVKNDYSNDDIIICQVYEPSGTTTWVAKS
jgi:hypothetical protein